MVSALTLKYSIISWTHCMAFERQNEIRVITIGPLLFIEMSYKTHQLLIHMVVYYFIII